MGDRRDHRRRDVLKLGPGVLLVWLAGRAPNERPCERPGDGARLGRRCGLARRSWHLPDVPRRRHPFRGHPDVPQHPGHAPSAWACPRRGTCSGYFCVVAFGCLTVVLLRKDSRRSFAVAVLAQPVRHDRRPTRDPRRRARRTHAVGDRTTTRRAGRSRRWRPVPDGLDLGRRRAVAVALSFATGGLRSSSMTLVNDTAAPVVLRFTVPSQAATFGFRLQPGEAGPGGSIDVGTVFSPVFVTTASCETLYQFRRSPA